MSGLRKARASLTMSWRLAGRRVWPLAIGVGLSLLVLTQATPLFEPVERAAYDAQYRLRLESPAVPNDIVIVSVSPGEAPRRRADSAQLLSYPEDWHRRAYIARAIDILRRAHARAIGIDLWFSHASPYGSPDDAALARAIKRAGNVVLTTAIVHDFVHGTIAFGPVDPLAETAAGIGPDSIPLDSDGVVRSVGLLQQGPRVNPYVSWWTDRGQNFVQERNTRLQPEPDGTLYPTWELVLASVALHQPVSQVLHGLPTNLLVNYIRSQSFNYDPHQNYWNGISLDDLVMVGSRLSLANRNFPFPVFCGASCAHGNPFRKFSLTNSVVLIVPAYVPHIPTHPTTPLGVMDGSIVQANILNTILRRNPILPAGSTGNAIILLLVGVVTAIAASRFGVWRSTGAAALIAVLFAAICVGLFAVMGIWVKIVAPEATIALVFLGIVAVRARVEVVRQKRAARYALQLAGDLQQSRQQLVTLREEERRRLRRDLHDGLGPALSSILLKVSAARRLLEPRSQGDSILLEARGDIQTTIDDIRRLVHDLRPPTLDELGLMGAIRESASGYEQGGLLVAVWAPEDLPPLPAAVEVAAYRIIQEALTNVIRHADAHTCTVELSIHDGLDIDVTDDGVGLPLQRHPGVGLTSMRERAAELGGSCVTEQAPGGGTRVRAHLPLPEA